MSISDSADNLDIFTVESDISSLDLIRTIKEMFTSTVDGLNSDITKRFVDLEMTEYKHHVENTTAHKNAEERITTRLESLEKISKKRTGELEKKIEQTNKKLATQIKKTTEIEDLHFRDLKKLITNVEVQEKLHQESIHHRVTGLETIKTDFVEMNDSYKTFRDVHSARLDNLDVKMSDLLTINTRVEELSENLRSMNEKIKSSIDNSIKIQEITVEMAEIKEKIKSMETEWNNSNETVKNKINSLESDWNKNREIMDKFMTEVKETPVETVQLEPIIKRIDEVKTNCTSNTNRVNVIEKDRKMMNIIVTGLLPRHQSAEGICEFAYNEMGVELSVEDIVHVITIAETPNRVVNLVKFSNLRARNDFFRGRIQLSPRARVWVNEDLTKIKESLAY